MHLQSKRGYNHTVRKSIHIVTSIKYWCWKTLKNLWLLLFLVFYRKLYRLFYTWHHHSSWKLKTRLNKIIHKEFYFKISRQHYKFIVLGDEITFFLKHVTKRKTWYTENEVISMLEFLIDNIFVKFIGHIFQQIICISIARNCAHLLFDDFLYMYHYEALFIQKSYHKLHKYRH
jgi:hypothetical protein